MVGVITNIGVWKCSQYLVAVVITNIGVWKCSQYLVVGVITNIGVWKRTYALFDVNIYHNM